MVEAAKKARQQMNAELGQIGKASGPGAGGGAFGEVVRAARKAAQDTTTINQRALSQQVGDLMRNLAMRKRAIEEEARAEEHAAQRRSRAIDHVLAVRQRYQREQQRLSDREARGDESFMRRTSYRTLHNAGTLVRGGSQVAKDIARGAGVETNIGSLVGQAVRLQSSAVQLSNAAFQNRPGEQRTDPSALISQTHAVGDKYSIGYESILGGLQQFTAKTGELDVGRHALEGLAELSKATGTNIEDMVGAAGEANKALEGMFTDPKEKADALNRILRVIAAQGKLGSVEVADLAKHMGRVAANASMFMGGRENVLEQLGAFAQFSMQGGGASSAAEATRAVAGFGNTLKTPARVKQFAAAGVDVFADRKAGKYKDPFEILTESIVKTKGDPLALKKMFANVVGAKPIESLAGTYRDAGGGAAGEKAVRERMKTFMQGMTGADVAESARRAGATKESSVQRFNNELAKVGEGVAERVLPAMEKLAPVVLQAVGGLGDLAAWTAENPLEAGLTGLGAVIMKSVAESILRASVENAIRGAAGMMPGAPGAKGGFMGGLANVPGGVAGQAVAAAGAALAIGAAAITVYEVGTLAIDKVLDMSNRAEDKTQDTLIESINVQNELKAHRREYENIPVGIRGEYPGAPPEVAAKAKAQEEMMAARIANAQKYGDMTAAGGMLSHAANFVSMGAVGQNIDATNQQRADAAQLAEMSAKLEELRSTMERTLGGELKVRVTNPTPQGPPQPSGRRVGMGEEPYPYAGL